MRSLAFTLALGASFFPRWQTGMVSYLVSLVIFTAIYALFSLGLNLQWGFTGLINFGHVAFMTIGAYITVALSSPGFLKAIPTRLIDHYPVVQQMVPLRDALLQLQAVLPESLPLVVAAIAGASLAAVLGLLIGMATLRLREDYLAIVTIGVAEVIRLVAVNEEWLTRGSFGIQDIPLPLENFRPNQFSRVMMTLILTVIVGLALWQLWRSLRLQLRHNHAWFKDSKLILAGICLPLGLWLYGNCAFALYNYNDTTVSSNPARNGLMLVTVILLALVFWRLQELVRSPWGRVLKAIREDEEVAKALGKNVFWYKLQSLMLGGFITGIAGSLYVWHLSTVYPDNFDPRITFDAWTIVVLGGAGNNVGTIVAAVIYWAYYTTTRFVIPAIAPALHTVLPFFPAQFNEARADAFRIMVIGLLLIVLMMARPQGLLGNKEELTLGR